jgi:hypothetical protein
VNKEDQELAEDLDELIAQMNPDHRLWKKDPARWRTLVSDDVRSLLPRVVERFRELSSGAALKLDEAKIKSLTESLAATTRAMMAAAGITPDLDRPLHQKPTVHRNFFVPAGVQEYNGFFCVTAEVPPGLPDTLVYGRTVAQGLNRWRVVEGGAGSRHGTQVMLKPIGPANRMALGVPLVIVDDSPSSEESEEAAERLAEAKAQLTCQICFGTGFVETGRGPGACRCFYPRP